MAPRVKRWLHLRMLGGDPWILPIWAAAHAAERTGKIQPLTNELRELGLHISTRLDILPRIVRRLNQEISELHKVAKGHRPEHVFTETKSGTVFRVDDDLKYSILADIDAFLFEANSCWELMRKLFQLVRAHVGSPIAGGRERVTNEIRAALGGASDRWIHLLDRHRNFVAHEGTLYLAVDVTHNGTWELLVMKENVKVFTDPTEFFPYSELVEVARGFEGTKQGLKGYLIGLF